MNLQLLDLGVPPAVRCLPLVTLMLCLAAPAAVPPTQPAPGGAAARDGGSAAEYQDRPFDVPAEAEMLVRHEVRRVALSRLEVGRLPASKVEADQWQLRGISPYPQHVVVVSEGPAADPGMARLMVLRYVPREHKTTGMGFWTGGVAWESESQRAYVVLVDSGSQTANVVLRVYAVGPTATIAGPKLDLKAEDYANWPKPVEPMSELETMATKGSFIGGVGRVQVTTGEDGLLICLRSRGESADTTFFRYDLKSKKWSLVKLTEGAPPRSFGHGQE